MVHVGGVGKMELALIVKLRLSTILIRYKSDIICVKKLYLLRSVYGVVAEHGPHGVPLGVLGVGVPCSSANLQTLWCSRTTPLPVRSPSMHGRRCLSTPACRCGPHRRALRLLGPGPHYEPGRLPVALRELRGLWCPWHASLPTDVSSPYHHHAARRSIMPL